MKTKLRILGVLIGLCSAVETTAVFGQTSYVWTNQNPALLTAGDLNQGTNWTVFGVPAAIRDPDGVPRPDYGPDSNGVYGDEMLFDGLTTGPLLVTQNGGSQANGGGSGKPYGLRVHLTSNQTQPVTIISPVGTSGGMRMNYFTIDAGAGGLRLGNHTANVLDIIGGVLNGQIFGFTNNSSTPCEINEDVRWRNGGAGTHPYVFAGTGDWIVNNHMRGTGGSAILLQKDGSGTMTWTGTNVGPRSINWFDNLGSPVRINGGTMILKSSDVVGTDAGSPNIVHNGTLFKYDAPVGVCTNAGVISGTGPIQVNAGSLMLRGTNTFTGNITLSGGTLVAGSTETVGVSGPLGVGGTISFTGGTLQFSTNNAFDYSPRFSTATAQDYRIDTAGQSVTLVTDLSSSDGTLTKTGLGALTLAGTSSYSGLTTVSAGNLMFQGSKTGAGNITVTDGAVLGVTATGTQITPTTLTLGSSSGCTMEIANVNSTTTPIISAGTLLSAGIVTNNIVSGTFTVGQTYPLFTWTNGVAPAVVLGSINGFAGNLSTNGNTIQLNVTAIVVTPPPPFPMIWTGNNNGSWDLTTTNNWRQDNSSTVFSNGLPAVFDDTASGTTAVTISSLVQPTSVTFSNSSKNYNVISSFGNNIAGGAGLTKTNGGTLTLSGGANTYTGVTTISGGVMAVGALANGGSPSDIGQAGSDATNLVLNGGTLLYTGGAARVDRLFTLDTGGGTINSSGSGALTLSNAGPIGLTGSGPRVLTLNGTNSSDNVFGGALADSPFGGATSLAKSGTGKWVLTGTNVYSSSTTIAAGTLQVGVGGASGSFGSGTVTNNGTVILNRSGSLTLGTVTGAGNLIFNSSGTVTVASVTGTGRVIQNGPGTAVLSGYSPYSGGTTINAGVLQADSQLNGLASVTNNGTLIFTGGDTSYGVISGTGQLIKRGSSLLTLVGNNTYTGGTTIDYFYPLQVGDGGTNGSLGTGPITNNGKIYFDRSDTVTLTNTMSGQGGLNQIGSGNLILPGTITLGDDVAIAGGTLLINGRLTINSGNGAAIVVYAGTLGGAGILSGRVILLDSGSRLAPGAAIGSIGTLTISNDLSISGDIAIEVNKSLSPSNDFVVVSGTLTNTGVGTLTVTNLGPALVIGDKFTLLSQPVQNGAALTVKGAGLNWANNLAVDGSISVIAPPTLNFTQTGNSIQFSWTGNFKLQAQTNNLNVGISTNWSDYPGAGSSPITVPISVTNGTVFFRLVSP